jgi:hypothetical protein
MQNYEIAYISARGVPKESRFVEVIRILGRSSKKHNYFPECYVEAAGRFY